MKGIRASHVLYIVSMQILQRKGRPREWGEKKKFRERKHDRRRIRKSEEIILTDGHPRGLHMKSHRAVNRYTFIMLEHLLIF